MNIAFVPFSVKCPQHKNSGSIRMRVEWIVKYLSGSFIALDPRDAEVADVVVFQKVYGPIINLKALRLKVQGKVLVFDLCDPMWLVERDSQALFEMMEMCDQIVVPTDKMKSMVEEKTQTPVTVIGDSMDLEYHDKIKQDHGDVLLPYVVWFGNRGTVKALQAHLYDLEQIWKQRKFKLFIISDELREEIQTIIPWEWIRWDLDTVNDRIMECDIAFNPKLDDPMDYPKSSNKTLTAWACGLPCVEAWPASNWKEYLLLLLLNWEQREQDGLLGRKAVEQKFTSVQAAAQWDKLCAKLLKEKNDFKNINSNVAGERE